MNVDHFCCSRGKLRSYRRHTAGKCSFKYSYVVMWSFLHICFQLKIYYFMCIVHYYFNLIIIIIFINQILILMKYNLLIFSKFSKRIINFCIRIRCGVFLVHFDFKRSWSLFHFIIKIENKFVIINILNFRKSKLLL